MKKLLALLVIVLLGSSIIQAQTKETEKVTNPKKNFFLAFHGGPSFPVSDFRSTSLSPDNLYGGGGFAKVGYNLNLQFGYEFTRNLGVAASVFYNNHTLHSKSFVDELNRIYAESGFSIDVTGLTLNHWQWYGMTAGPAVMLDLKKNVFADLRLMGGVARANSPRVDYNGEKIFDEDWSAATMFQGGADVRIGFSKRGFVMVNLDYMYMNPTFTTQYSDPVNMELYIEKGEQKLETLNLTIGVGFRF